MTTIKNIIELLGLTVMTCADKSDRPVKGAYTSDLLSDVMGKAKEGELWITMQTHKNIIAVAALKDLSAILIVNGGRPDADTLATAAAEGVVLLGTAGPAFDTSGRLYQIMKQDAMVQG
jgi:hypothetical protein